MRKKLLVLFLATVSAVCLCMGLSACGEHTHTAGETVKENEVAATCTTDGSYYNVTYCSECGEVISSQYVVVEATGHSWNNGEVTTAATCTDRGVITYTCTACGETKTEYTSANGHTYTSEVIEEATCGHNGKIRYTCSVCGYTFDSTVKNTGISHTLTHVDAVAATETSDGNIEYWYCSVCGKLFTDSEGTTEVTPSYVLINALSHVHSLEYVAATAATCTEDGNTWYWYCSECGKLFTDKNGTNETSLTEVTIAASHTLEYVAAKDATDTEDGNREYWYCSACGKYFSDSAATTETTLDALTITHHTHIPVHVSAVAATCITEGNIEYWYCSECGLCFSDSACTTIISSEDITTATINHSRSHIRATEATCTTDGNVEYWRCSVCGTIFSDRNETVTTLEAVTIKATGHTTEHTEAVAATCTTDGNIEYWYCTVCGKYYSDSEYTTEITLADTVIDRSHTMTYYAPAEATDSADGNIEYWYCSVCEKYFLDGDGATETTLAAVTIAVGHQHSITTVAAVAATCTTAGNIEYYTCSTCGISYLDSTATTLATLADITILAAGHTYDDTYTYNGNATYDENGHWQVCTVCGEQSAVESHTYNSSNVCTVCGYTLANTLYYTLSSDGKSYTVSGIGTYASTDLVIPETYNGLPVTAIAGSAFRSNTKLTSVVIPDSIITIGDYAFLYCSNIKTVEIGNSVTSVSYQSFAACTALETVTIGSSVDAIEQQAFTGCTSLKTIYIPSSVETIGYQAFYNCSSLESVTGGGELTSIENAAFYGCTSLSKFNSTTEGECVISDNVISFGEHTFQYTAFETVIIGSKVTSIETCAFCYCETIKSVVMSLSIDEIGYAAFYGCIALESVTFNEISSGSNLKNIDQIAFYGCTSLKSIEIPASVETIATNVFYGCTALESVTFLLDSTTGTSSLKTIEKQAFAYCSALTSIELPASVETLGYAAFYYCTSLASVTGCEGLVTISDGAFNGCSELTSFTIGSNVTSIGTLAFSNCTKLASVTFADTENWYITESESAPSGNDIVLTDPSQNATYLVTDYKSYYWYKA